MKPYISHTTPQRASHRRKKYPARRVRVSHRKAGGLQNPLSSDFNLHLRTTKQIPSGPPFPPVPSTNPTTTIQNGGLRRPRYAAHAQVHPQPPAWAQADGRVSDALPPCRTESRKPPDRGHREKKTKSIRTSRRRWIPRAFDYCHGTDRGDFRKNAKGPNTDSPPVTSSTPTAPTSPRRSSARSLRASTRPPRTRSASSACARSMAAARPPGSGSCTTRPRP